MWNFYMLKTKIISNFNILFRNKMKKDAIKIIQDNKVSLETINQSINDFVDNLLDDVLDGKGGRTTKTKKDIQTHNEKITPCFAELVQLHLDTTGKATDEATKARITANYKLFKEGFSEIMGHTKYGFYQFIYEAWYHLLMGLCNEAIKEGNKKVSDLSLALFRDVNKAYNLVYEENKKEFWTKE